MSLVHSINASLTGVCIYSDRTPVSSLKKKRMYAQRLFISANDRYSKHVCLVIFIPFAVNINFMKAHLLLQTIP